MALHSLLLRALNPWVWRTSHRTARKLHGFAQVEHASMLDMRLAARLTPSPARASAYLRHADDEARHAQMFARVARQLSAEPRVTAPLVADSDQLFARLGEVDFLAFVHHGEVRALAQFETYVAWFRDHGRSRERALFEAVMVDERRHVDYSRELLDELAGGASAARAALRRVARWELGRRWMRQGRFVAQLVYTLCMFGLYVVSLPLGLIVRWRRPITNGFAKPPALEPQAAPLPSEAS